MPKTFYQIKKNEKHTIKNKTHKNWKTTGTTYCLGCKDFIHKFRLQEIKMTNKVLREKSDCIVCPSSKSRFLRQNTTTKNNWTRFLNYKNGW